MGYDKTKKWGMKRLIYFIKNINTVHKILNENNIFWTSE